MFSLFNLTFHWYGLIVGLAVSLVWWLATDLSQTFSLPTNLKRHWWLVAIGALIGARLWHLVTDWEIYAQALTAGQWWRLISVWQGGLSIIGAIAGMILVVLILSRKSYLISFDVLALVLPLGQAVGRLANYVNQELYGKPTNLPWGIQIDFEHRLANVADLNQAVKFHPLFAYEALALSLLAFSLWQLSSRYRNWQPGEGKLSLLYLSSYSWLRFGLDFLRIDRGPVWRGLGVNQWLMASVGILCLFIWLAQFMDKQSLKKKLKNFFQYRPVWLILVLLIWLIWLLVNQIDRLMTKPINLILAQKPDQAKISIFWQRRELSGSWKNLNLAPLQLTLVSTEHSREVGLGGQAQLENDGMLFEFNQPARWQFWMKGMNFGLDFIWIKDGKVIEITPNVPPPNIGQAEADLSIISPRNSIDQVIELAAGRAKNLDIRVGDKILIQ